MRWEVRRAVLTGQARFTGVVTIQQKAQLSRDEDAALEALRREDNQVSRVTSASSSSPSATPASKKRPLPTGLVPQEKTKKLAAKPPPIWAEVGQAIRESVYSFTFANI